MGSLAVGLVEKQGAFGGIGLVSQFGQFGEDHGTFPRVRRIDNRADDRVPLIGAHLANLVAPLSDHGGLDLGILVGIPLRELGGHDPLFANVGGRAKRIQGRDGEFPVNPGEVRAHHSGGVLRGDGPGRLTPLGVGGGVVVRGVVDGGVWGVGVGHQNSLQSKPVGHSN